jgi:hypothetical protein
MHNEIKIKTHIILSTELAREIDANWSEEKLRNHGPASDALRLFNADGTIIIDCHTQEIEDFEREMGAKVNDDVIDDPVLFHDLSAYLLDNCELEITGFGTGIKP